MAEAAEKLGYSSSVTARRALQADKLPLISITPKLLMVDEDVLNEYIKNGGGNSGKGRPKKNIV